METRAIIVDDEAARCELIEKVLTSAGIESLTVTKSNEAPEILHTEASRWYPWTTTWIFRTGGCWRGRCGHRDRIAGHEG